ncbi:MAG: BamA/TamA family outer membrane protein [Bacteroidia bacterium]
MLFRKINKYFLVVCTLFFVSCTATRFLPAGEKLYTGADIELKSSEKIKNKKFIIKNAELAVRPKPNQTFLGMRPKLWLYYIAGDSANKGFRKWVKNKLGEPPVLMNAVKPSETAKYIDAKLYNIGIFKTATFYEIKEKKKTARIEYICSVHNPYTIKDIKYPPGDDLLSELIISTKDKSLIKQGDNYDLSFLKMERERIDATLKDNGYFYFNPDYLLFKADTNENDKTINLELTFKDETPYEALLAYRINNIYIDPEYSLQDDPSIIKRDSLVTEDVIFLGVSKIRPKVILRSVFFRKNDVYSRKNHNITLNRIMTMGNFKYVNIKFTECDTGNPGFLDAMILLTPMPKRTFRSELTLVSKSNDFIGPKLSLNYRNRNEFNGAELLNLNLSGSIETQLTGKYKNLYTYEINPVVELYIPRFVVPFKIKNPSSYYIPKTKFSLGYSYLKRVGYFNLTSLQFSYGFKWKENIKTEHELDPINIEFTSISNKSQQFDSLLEINPFLKKSYEEQFIAGIFYSYTFSEQVIPGQKSQFYINPTAELSGNALSLATKVFSGETASPENPQRVAGSVYSQFARLTVDARNYINFPKKNRIAVRLYTGIGKAYGNSSILPYVRQFFSGGPNSIRAFQINSLGPGTFLQTSDNTTAYLEYGGDVKVEANAEYRCNLISIIKGAVFIDAGNVWLLKANPAIDSQPFAFSGFYKEIAVGTGLGLRIDASFFVLRFDLAFPLRKPWLEENKRWVVNEIDFGSSGWRSDNFVLNIAIGYPF